MTDRELLNKVSLHDHGAYNRFYKKYIPLLYKWAYKRMENKEMVEDCLQEFWLTVWNEPLKIKTDEQGCAKNFILHHLTYFILNYIDRSEISKAGRKEVSDLDEIAENRSYCHVEEEQNTEELSSIVSELIDELPDTVKEAVSLHWHRNYTNKEIAAELKIDERTVRNKVQNGMRIMQEQVKKIYDQDKNNTDRTLIPESPP